MNIAIVSGGFFETSVPLVDVLLKAGHSVDFYCVCQHPDMFTINNAFEFKGSFHATFSQQVSNQEIRGMQFIKSQKLSTFLICYNCIHTKGLFGRIINSWFWPYLLKKMIRRFKQNKYDYIAVIGHNFFLYELSILLNNTSIIHTHSLHEVVDHAGDGHIFDFVPFLHNAGVPLVLHSNAVKNSLAKKGFNMNNTYVIPFGPCIGFNDFEKNEKGILNVLGGNKYFLSYGYISKYKGYELLWNTYKLLKKEGNIDFKIVVAGRGYDPYVERMKNCNDFIVINRFIKNDELVTLISHAVAVLCPYKSVSQSGIPQTCITFGVPVIATAIGAFRETIIPGKNGFLVHDKEKDFANSMLASLNTYLQNYCIPEGLQWEKIVYKYEALVYTLKSQNRERQKNSIWKLYFHDLISKAMNKNKIGG